MRADTICTGPGPDNRKMKQMHNLTLSPLLHSHQFLHFRDPTSFISTAYSVGLSGTRNLVHRHYRGSGRASRLYVCGSIRPTEQGGEASGHTAESEESVQPPIPPNYRVLHDVFPRMVVLRLVVYCDRAVTHGKSSDSAWFSASRVCKDSC
jgi:hypothetical protein